MKFPLILLSCFFLSASDLLHAQEIYTTKDAGLIGPAKKVTGCVYEIENQEGKWIRDYADTYDKQGNCLTTFSTCDIPHRAYSPRTDIERNGVSYIMLIKSDFVGARYILDENDKLICKLEYDCKGPLRDSIVYVYDVNNRLSERFE